MPAATEYVRFSFGTPPHFGRITQVGLLRHGQGSSASMRVIDSYALAYSLDGVAHYRDANGIARDLRPGDALLVFPELPHRYGPQAGERWSEFYLVFDGPAFDLWRENGLLDPFRPVLHCEPTDYWLQRLESVPDAPRQPGGALVEACRLLLLLAEMSAAAHSQVQLADERQAIARACALLESDTSRDLDMPSLAGQLGMPYPSFRKRFVELIGMPPGRYRTVKLVERACELMQRGGMPDRQIAETLGFCDEYYFSRRFKAVTGMSPRAFRRGLSGWQTLHTRAEKQETPED